MANPTTEELAALRAKQGLIAFSFPNDDRGRDAALVVAAIDALEASENALSISDGKERACRETMGRLRRELEASEAKVKRLQYILTYFGSKADLEVHEYWHEEARAKPRPISAKEAIVLATKISTDAMTERQAARAEESKEYLEQPADPPLDREKVRREATVATLNQLSGIIGGLTMIGPSPIGPLHCVGWNEGIQEACKRIEALRRLADSGGSGNG